MVISSYGEARLRPAARRVTAEAGGRFGMLYPSMAKRPTKAAAHSWAIYHLKGTPAQFVGIIWNQPDEKSAIAGAIEEYKVPPNQRDRLIAPGADVPLNNTANYFDGPSTAQGASGTWFAAGTITLTDTGTTAIYACKLWDGTTVISSGQSGGFGGRQQLGDHILVGIPCHPRRQHSDQLQGVGDHRENPLQCFRQ
jgi:hypothetical protein